MERIADDGLFSDIDPVSRLVKIYEKLENDGECIIAGKREMAKLLIANGVTVQEWISVKDRLPDEECRCLVIDAAGDIEMDCYDGKGRFVLDRSGAVQHPSHWMPLPKMPQPPKGE